MVSCLNFLSICILSESSLLPKKNNYFLGDFGGVGFGATPSVT